MRKEVLLPVLFAWALLPGIAKGQVVINEIQVANVDMFIDPSFNYGSWVELYNPTEQSFSLENMRLRHTNSEGTIKEQRLTEQHGILEPGGFCVLWFGHNSSSGYYGKTAGQQIPFEMDEEGGIVELRDARDNLLDAVSYPPAITRCSFARVEDGSSTWGVTSMPSPNRPNAGSSFSDERLAMPETDRKGGVFSQPFTLQVAVPAGTTLHYTTDGATPVPGKSLISETGTFPVSETTILRFMLTKDGYLNSPVTTRSFFINNHDWYLPIVSVTTHPDNLFSDSIGLYVGGVNGRTGNNMNKPMNQNMDWERPVNVEYLVPDTQTGQWHEALNQGALFSIFGGWTRFNDGDENFQYKPSFKLKADKWCEGLNFYPYPVFQAKPYIKNKTLLVRNGGQDQHGRIWDAVIQELLQSSGINLDCQATQPAHIFLDGLPLGMFNLREASNRNYAYSNYGIGSDEVDQWENEFQIKAGSSAIYNTWRQLCQNLAANPTDTLIWQSICNIVDIDEYCNYMAAEIYMGNLDWLRGGLKNIKGFRCNKDDGKIHVVVFDLDGCFGDTDMIAQIYKKGSGKQIEIFKNMMKYPPFRQQFIDAYCIMGGSIFLPERCLPIIRQMEANIAPALLWENNEPHTRADRLCNALTDRENQHDKRISTLKTQLGLTNEMRVDIETDNPLARILLNGREIPTSRFSGTLFETAELTAVIPEGYEFAGWQVNGKTVSTDSILNLSDYANQDPHITLTLKQTSTISPIRINEVSSANDIYINEYLKKSDWIELYNTTDTAINLAGAYLSDNPRKPHKYQIPVSEESIIPAHGYRIVWCDNREPISQLHAAFKLENTDNAFVSIHAEDDSWADSLQYQAQGRWQSYGRFPDGADRYALFDRITIGGTNHINTNTVITTPDLETSMKTVRLPQHRQIISIQYYNLNGQRLQNITGVRILIRQIIYDDGTVESKMIINNGIL
ncbi:MAG: lamin tail domain-containing protein [Bacteroidaceae bacterium]|nr:lamin tail domain-containing protein [Bacteroidaceae bacterium]